MPTTALISSTPETQTPVRSRGRGVLLLLAVALLWSLVGLSVKIPFLANVKPMGFTFYRSLGALAGMLLALPWSHGRRPNIPWMLLSAMIYTGVITLFIISTKTSTAAIAIYLQYTAPAWCALLAWVFQRRRISGRTALAMACAMTGIAVILLSVFLEKRVGWIGPLAGAGSGVFFAAIIMVLEKLNLASGGKVNPVQIVVFNNLGAALVLLPIALSQDALGVTPGQAALLAGFGVVLLAMPYVMLQVALRHVEPVDASLLMTLEPALNPVWVALLTPEHPSKWIVCGGIFIVAALVIEAFRSR